MAARISWGTSAVADVGYKHISARYAAAFWSGLCIQLGTYEAYRKSGGERADQDEGFSVFDYNGEYDHESSRRLLNIGIELENIKKTTVEGTIVRKPLGEDFIFCCSEEPDFSRCAKYGEVIVRIDDLLAFGVHVGRCLPAVEHMNYGPVHYDKRAAKIAGGDEFQATPFHKAPEYGWEKEVRIVWYPDYPIVTPLIRVRAPKAARFMTLLAIP